jgi:hypothetical protein
VSDSGHYVTSEQAYRFGLLLYPADYRARFATEMAAAFDQAARQHGSAGATRAFARRAQKRGLAIFAFWVGIAVLTALWYQNITGPPPPDARTAAIGSFAFFSLSVTWGYWMNRLRTSALGRSQIIQT